MLSMCNNKNRLALFVVFLHFCFPNGLKPPPWRLKLDKKKTERKKEQNASRVCSTFLHVYICCKHFFLYLSFSMHTKTSCMKGVTNKQSNRNQIVEFLYSSAKCIEACSWNFSGRKDGWRNAKCIIHSRRENPIRRSPNPSCSITIFIFYAAQLQNCVKIGCCYCGAKCKMWGKWELRGYVQSPFCWPAST